METYTLDYTREDIGEIIQMIRVQKFKLTVDAFAYKIGVKSNVLEMAEEGKGAHVFTIFNKCIDNGYLNAELVVTIK